MIKGIYHSAAGMIARQRQMEVIANNLANADTVGFREEIAVFRSKAPAQVDHPVIKGEKLVCAERGIPTSPSFGALRVTDNPLDAAIVGDGYFMIETDTGIAYTRNGRFQINTEGMLVSQDGNPVLTDGGVLQVPEGASLRINPEGELILEGEDGQPDQVLDRLRLVVFEDPGKLRPLGNGLFASDQQPLELDEMELKPGYLEDSTVNLVEQMVEMIQVNRLYEASSKSIQTQDATLGKAVNEVGKIF
jgi:flagellar basal-body rod protein FlgG